MLISDPFKRPSTAELLQDKVLIQLMINNSSQTNLKKQYPKSIPQPTLTDSFIEKQYQIVNQYLKKLDSEVKSKMDALKQKKIEKNVIDEYYNEVKKKMS